MIGSQQFNVSVIEIGFISNLDVKYLLSLDHQDVSSYRVILVVDEETF